jgi:HprK-related kinase A
LKTIADILQGRTIGRDGVALSVPPFSFQIRSENAPIDAAFGRAYGHYPVADTPGFIDFDLTVRRRPGPLGWIKPMVELDFDGKRPFDPLPLDQAFPLLEWAMNWCVTSTAHQFVMCHAAVLADQDQAVILPAPPGSGKSTLCAILSLSGWRLLSDELALIDPESLDIQPFVRPVSLKNASIDVIAQRFAHAELTPPVHDTIKGTVAHLRAPLQSVLAGTQAARARRLIFPRYLAHAALKATPLGKAEATAQLAANAFNLAAIGTPCVDTLYRLVGQCECLTLTYSSIDEALAFFDALRKGPPAR